MRSRHPIGLLTLLLVTASGSLLPGMEVPERAQATCLDQSRIALSWESLAGVSSITVERSPDGGNWQDIASLGGSATSHTDTGLSADTLYLYRLRISGGGPAQYGNLCFARTTRLVAAGDAPTRIYAYYHPDGGVRIRWQDRYADETAYRLQRKAEGGSFSDLISLPADSDGHTDNGAPDGTIHYRLRAEKGGSATDWIETVTGLSAPGSNWFDGSSVYVANPARDASIPTVSGLSYTHLGPHEIRISWTAPAGISEFLVLRGRVGSEYQSRQMVSTTSFDLSSVFLGTEQLISVISKDGDVYGLPSAPIAVAPVSIDDQLIPPQNVQAVEDGDDVVLSWEDPNDHETAYIVEEATGAPGEPSQALTLATLAADTTSYRIVDGSSFDDFRVVAASAAGYSQPSREVRAYQASAPEVPTNLRTTDLSPTAVHLAWDHGGTYYYHYRIERQDADGTWYACNQTEELNYTDRTVVPGGQYRYRITRVHPVMASDELVVDVPLPGSAPNKVGSLNASAAGEDQINLRWTLGGSATTRVRIDRRPDGGSWQEIADLPRAATRFSDAGLAASSSYDYRVTASNTAGAASAASTGATTASSATSWSTNTLTGAEAGLKTLVVTTGTANDDCEIRQVGDRVDIYRDGSLWQSKTGDYAEIKVYGGDGDDRLRVHPSTTIRTLLYGQNGDDELICDGGGWQAAIAIGHGFDAISGDTATATYWADSVAIDSIDSAAAGTTRRVLNFIDDRSKELKGQDWKEPGNYEFFSDTRYPDTPFWGDGPAILDINQGTFQSCPVTSLGQHEIWIKPAMVQHSAVDLGDHTFIVQVDGGYHRMDEDLAPGTVSILPLSGRKWWLFLEKTHYVNGLPFPQDAVVASGAEIDRRRRLGDGEHFYRWARQSLADGAAAINFTRYQETDYQAVGSPGQHAHTLISCFRDADGEPRFILRNPYGLHYEYSYGLLDPWQGLRVVDYSQFLAFFLTGGFSTRDNTGKPYAEDLQVTVAAGERVGIPLMAYHSDALQLTYEIVDAPARGSLDGVGPWRRFQDAGTTAGSTSFTYRVSDGSQTSRTATVTITIEGDDPPTNQAPSIITAASASPANVTGMTTGLSVSATDADGDDLSYSWQCTDKPSGSAPSFATGQRQPTVTFDQAGSYTFQVTVSDGSDSVDGGSVTVTVQATPDRLEILPD